uniref:C-type lectin domain-containing protein n=2 Tax=Panagrellus redivivus TaxID=6233 RepID=A0A7E4VLB5_PANRE
MRLLLITSVLLLGSNVALGGKASPNSTVCCPPFDKRVESNGTVFCFANLTIPNDRATIGNYLCRKLNPHANLASFHSIAELRATGSLGPAITGLVYEFDEFTWRDGTPVDFTYWYSNQPSMNSSEAVVEVNDYGYFSTVTMQGLTNRKAFCKMEAEYTECPDCESCALRIRRGRTGSVPSLVTGRDPVPRTRHCQL